MTSIFCCGDPARILEDSAMVTTYEKRLTRLESEKALLAEKAARSRQPQRTFEDLFEHAMRFLANPCILWDSERLEDKRAVLKLAFSDRLAYCRDQGFRTPKIALPFKVLQDFQTPKFEMARPGGLEPPTLRFEA